MTTPDEKTHRKPWEETIYEKIEREAREKDDEHFREATFKLGVFLILGRLVSIAAVEDPLIKRAFELIVQADEAALDELRKVFKVIDFMAKATPEERAAFQQAAQEIIALQKEEKKDE